MSQDKIATALVNLAELFRRREENNLAIWCDRMVALAETDPTKYEETLLSVNVWGGSGSLFDFLFYGEEGMQRKDFRDNLLKDQLMLDIMVGLKQRGYGPTFFGISEATIKTLMSYYELKLQED